MDDDGVAQMLFDGRVSVEEARSLANAVIRAGDDLGPFPILVDLDRLADFDSGARQVFARPSRPYPLSAVAYFGGPFATKTLIHTIVRAGKLIAPKSFVFEVQWFPTEAESRRFLAQFGMKNAAGT